MVEASENAPLTTNSRAPRSGFCVTTRILFENTALPAMNMNTPPLKIEPENDEDLLVKRQVRECALAHDVSRDISVTYFQMAEAGMEHQWKRDIWPRIKDFDFSVTLDLAAGHGRNSEMLKTLAGEIYIVDVNQSCIDACKARFGDTDGKCRFHYIVNDGYSLKEIPDSSITAVYSWDAMVHFDKLVVKRYIAEFARVLKNGGKAFFHHSNYGHVSPEDNWCANPGWRTNTTREFVAECIQSFGLQSISQDALDWKGSAFDAITICSKAR